ncbi:MAG: hypothetical protein ACYSSI_00215 [Planctomycetota bacterium]|jgi:hypothetical protein
MMMEVAEAKKYCNSVAEITEKLFGLLFEGFGVIEQLQAELEKHRGLVDKLVKMLSDGILLSGDGLETLNSMASVDFMVKACTGNLTPTDVAESINGIIKKAKEKTQQVLAEAEKE